MSMATKSFLKEVVIKDSTLARGFVNALSESAEKAKDKKQKTDTIELSRPSEELKVEEIKDFFGVK